MALGHLCWQHPRQTTGGRPSLSLAGWQLAAARFGLSRLFPPNTEILAPFKKPRGNLLSPSQKSFNRQLASLRIRIEHVISSVKRCRIVKDPCKLRGIPAQDLVMEIACALHNFRLFISPWSP